MLRHVKNLARSKAVSTERRTMTPAGDQCRCGCGSLLARVVREGLELKCRRCKCLVLITHDELTEMYRRLDLPPVPLTLVGAAND
jgi:phage FluMu protein Com